MVTAQELRDKMAEDAQSEAILEIIGQKFQENYRKGSLEISDCFDTLKFFNHRNYFYLNDLGIRVRNALEENGYYVAIREDDKNPEFLVCWDNNSFEDIINMSHVEEHYTYITDL